MSCRRCVNAACSSSESESLLLFAVVFSASYSIMIDPVLFVCLSTETKRAVGRAKLLPPTTRTAV